MQLQLVVGDFHLEPGELTGGASDVLPRLPGFEALLRWGRRRHLPRDWRGHLAGCAGRPDLVAVPPAQVAAAAIGVVADANPWFATPVHLTAGLDHLRLHRAGLLKLSREDLDALASDFATVFGGSGLTLRPLLGTFVLSGLLSQEPSTLDPAAFLGADIGRAPPRGAGAAELRRLASELEMWLHEHVVNRQRQRRGQLPVNALWVWGGGAPVTPHGLTQRALGLPRAYADDAYVAGLWISSGGEAQPLPENFATLCNALAAGETRGRVVVVLSAAARDAKDDVLPRIDAEWIAPAVAALGAGAVTRVELYCGGLWLRMARRDRLRIWRRARPWWEAYRA